MAFKRSLLGSWVLRVLRGIYFCWLIKSPCRNDVGGLKKNKNGPGDKRLSNEEPRKPLD